MSLPNKISDFSMAYTFTRGAPTTPFHPFLKSSPKKHQYNCHNYLFLTNYAPILPPLPFKPSKLSCGGSDRVWDDDDGDGDDDDESLTSVAAAYSVLGVEPNCSTAQLKAAFRAKVKEYHPDVRSNQHNSDLMIRRVIQAYEILSNISRSEIIESECVDPFDNPECEAFDIFVNETLCAGKGCPYSCVKQAPHAFTFSSLGTACATYQGRGEDYRVQLAVGQCPKSCIHYVTPSQRIILEELLDCIVNAPYVTSAEADLLYSLITKAKFENNRYQKPKKQPKASTEHVDWF